MLRSSALPLAAAAALIAARLAAGRLGADFWGLNHLGYLGAAKSAAFAGAALFCLALAAIPPLREKAAALLGRELPAWAIGLAAFLILVVAPPAATPLLGDGMDRIEATPAGFSILRDQPAPLDLALHVAAYKTTGFAAGDPWLRSWRVWRAISYIAGGLAIAALWALARARAADGAGRAIIFFSCLGGGYLLFFMGYAENYVTLAAGLFGYMVLAEAAAAGKAPVWTLFAGLGVLVGLHFFMILLLPGLAIMLYRHRMWAPKKIHLVAAGAALLAFAALALYLVEEHYRGVANIFVAPADWLSAYHLIGLANQACIAFPLLPLLVVVFPARQTAASADPLMTFAGWSSAVLAAFFLFLRPVIGPAADWDLFAVPFLVIGPTLALRAERATARDAGRRSATAFAALASAIIWTGPWIMVNVDETAAIARYRDAMEWEAGHNPHAAAYGYYRLGKYMARTSDDPDKIAALAAFDRTLELRPRSATLHKQVAAQLSAMGRPGLAARAMARHHLLMAEYHESRGEFEDAADHYRRSLFYRDDSPAIIEKLIELYEGPLDDPRRARTYRDMLRREKEGPG